jgi:1-aminocyclopropane-1-carboxylate deaminase
MKSLDLILPSPLQELTDPVLTDNKVRVFVKRDDLIHPEISGNKWRKLQFNLEHARNYRAIASFGGAYSNHLFALASLGQKTGIQTIGIVRGQELNAQSSPTLRHCADRGMELHFVSREDYRLKQSSEYFRSNIQASDVFVVPEGGTNRFALTGVGEIVNECDNANLFPDYFVVPAGTGGTASGILAKGRNVLAIAVLKGASFLKEDIAQWEGTSAGLLDLQLNYHFGGYGKYTQELLEFIEQFEQQHGIPLEQVYTGKMFYGLFDLIKRGYFAKETTLVALHTGGLQGKLNI